MKKSFWVSTAIILLLWLLSVGVAMDYGTPNNHTLTRTANQYHQKLNNHWAITKADRAGDLILMGSTKTRLIVQFLQKHLFYYQTLVNRTYSLKNLHYRTIYDLMPIKRANYFVYGKLNSRKSPPTIDYQPTSSMTAGKYQIWYGLESGKLNQTLRFR